MEMIAGTTPNPAARAPAWFWAAGAFGVLWNVYGVVQFAGSLAQTEQGLMASGLTAEQAAVYSALPAWVSAVFALGVFGGLAGCVLLLLRRGVALPVLAASLAGYVALFAGDAGYGVFAGNPAQLAVLGVVVTVAAALLGTARIARMRGIVA